MRTMRKILGSAVFAAALAATGAAFAAGSSGDIYDIVPCDRDGTTRVNGAGAIQPWASYDSPLVSGETVYFKIRLVATSNTVTDTAHAGAWTVKYTGLGDITTDKAISPLRVGIFVRGETDEYDGSDVATLVDYKNTADYKFTELIFEYKTKPGDFALPAVLMSNNGIPMVKDSGATGFKFYNTDKWEIVNGFGDTVNFSMWEVTAENASWGITQPEGVDRWKDVTLQRSGIYIKTLDFDGQWAVDGATWRTVHQNSAIAKPATPALAMEAAYSNANAVTMHVWSDDESAVRIQGGTLTCITNGFDSSNNPVTNWVQMGTVTIAGGALTKDFQIWGVSQTGGASGDGKCNLVLSPYAGYTFYDSTGTAVLTPFKNYITVPVQCIEPLPPTLYVERENGDTSFEISAPVGTAYTNVLAILKVRLSQPAAEQLQVSITNSFTEAGYAGNWTDYVCYSTNGRYPAGSEDAKPVVTIEKGALEATEKIYLFAKTADRHTAALNCQIAFHPEVVAGDESFLEGYEKCTAYIYADDLQVTGTSADENESNTVSGICNVPFDFKIYVDDVLAATTNINPGFTIQWKRLSTDTEWKAIEGRYYYGDDGGLYRMVETTNTDSTVTYSLPAEGVEPVAPRLVYPAATGEAGIVSAIRVTSPVADRNTRRATKTFNVIISDPKNATMRTYLPSNPVADVTVFTESYTNAASIDITLSEINNEGNTLYAYLVPQNAFDIGKIRTEQKFIVGQTNQTAGVINKLSGLPIPKGADSCKNTPIWFLDGTEMGQYFIFQVVILDDSEWDGIDKTKIRTDYGSANYTVSVRNAEPSITRLELDGIKSVKNGARYSMKLPVGSTHRFRAVVTDPGTYDLTNTNGNDKVSAGAPGDLFRTRWTTYLDDAARGAVEIYGNPSKYFFTNRFTRAGIWRIECEICDKDMPEYKEDFYSVEVEVLNQPSVILNDNKNGGGLGDIYENDLERANFTPTNLVVSLDYFDPDFEGDLWVAIKVKSSAPSGDKNPGVLKFNAPAWTTQGPQGKPFEVDNSTGDVLEADAEADWYILQFNSQTLRRNIGISMLDGTIYDFTIEAFVAWSEEFGTVDTNLPASGRVAKEYYLRSALDHVKVFNVEPALSGVTPVNNASNRWNVAGGLATQRPIGWAYMGDIANDFTNSWRDGVHAGLLVSIQGPINATNIYITSQSATSGTFVPDFGQRTGDQIVTVTFTDKDSTEPQTYDYYYFVKPSKYLELTALGPSTSGAGNSTLSDKYKRIMAQKNSRGQGHVWANRDDASFTGADRFTLSWNCSGDLSQSIWAWGYRQTNQLDNGTLEGGRDIWLPPSGTRSATATKPTTDGGFYDYSNNSESSKIDGRDSFFYCWIQHDPLATDLESAATLLKGIISPEQPGYTSPQTIALPEDEEDVASYPRTIAEAVFALELYKEDNLGDINADGVPDIFAINSSWGAGGNQNLIELAGGERFVDDLMDLSETNPSGDWLPGVVGQLEGNAFVMGSGKSYAPATNGIPFGVLLNIRGFGMGLNDNNQYFTLSDPMFNEEEARAWTNAMLRIEGNGLDETTGAVTNAAGTVEWDLSVWSPEPYGGAGRMDPARLSTDGDPFPDGWEYFFWYQAKVWQDAWASYEAEIESWGDNLSDEQRKLRTRWQQCPGRPRPGQTHLFERFNVNNIIQGDEIAADEVLNRFNPCERLTAGTLATYPDFDNDGLSDLEELVIGTNPCHWDTDGDRMCDAWEYMYGLDPLTANGIANPDGDFMAWINTSKLPVYVYNEEAETGYVNAEGVAEYDPEAEAKNPYAAGQRVFVLIGLEPSDVSESKLKETKSFECFSFTPFMKGSENFCYGGTNAIASTEGVDTPPSAFWGKRMAGQVMHHEARRFLAGTPLQQGVEFVLVHDQVKTALGYDPRTAWNQDQYGYVASRWNESANSWAGGGQGVAMNTRPYYNFDEYLLMEYVREFLDHGYYDTRFNTDDEGTWTVIRKTTTNPNIILTASSSSSSDDGESTEDEETEVSVSDVVTTGDGGDSQTYSVKSHGADTDGDGVPDGWELYNGRNPIRGLVATGDSAPDSQDGDGLNLRAEYVGVDSCAAYATRTDDSGNVTWYGCTSISTNPRSDWKNKFFPTDPDDPDTDGDGVNDGVEGSTWRDSFYNDGRVYDGQTFTFVYGEGVDDGTQLCFRGGGMNPCTIDTDFDGLPDGWEMQHAGVVATIGEAGEDGAYTLTPAVFSDATKIADRLFNSGATGNSVNVGAVYIAGGMDATWRGDAYTKGLAPEYEATTDESLGYDPITGTKRDLDFDHDGLENWQEYLVQTMRHFRYDDITTPLMGRLLKEGSYVDGVLATPHEQQYKGFVKFDASSSEAFAARAATTWYDAATVQEYTVTTGVRTVVTDVVDDDGNYIVKTNAVTATRRRILSSAADVVAKMEFTGGEFSYGWTESGWRSLGYFATPAKAFDRAKLGSAAMLCPPVYMLPAIGKMATRSSSAGWSAVYCAGYVSTDPRMADTDGDGMDDYYELFHGLNPILGAAPNYDSATGDDTMHARPSSWLSTGDDGNGKHGDIIALVYGMAGGGGASYYNAYFNEWIYPEYDRAAGIAGLPQPTGLAQLKAPMAYDPVMYPWTMGSPLADADGDGVRNDEERILANVADPVPTHTDPTPLWFTERTSRSSFVWQYYAPGELLAGVMGSTFSAADALWIYPFEENEGYDTDNDFTPDSFEVIKMSTPYSDPQRFTDPFRRQALYLDGVDSYAMSWEKTLRPEGEADFLRQFTVECWVKPEKTGAAQTIVERSCVYEGNAINKDAFAIRANFRIGLTADGAVYGMFDNNDAKESGADEPVSCQRVNGGKIEAGADAKWSHVALTFDGKTLKIYVDGTERDSARTTLVPANGVVGILQNPAQTSTFPSQDFQSSSAAFFIGARPQAKTLAALHPYYPFTLDADELESMEHQEKTENVREFFQGYVDEVRVWDGARTGAEIYDSYRKAMTWAEVAANREEVYLLWAANATRNNNDGNKTLPPELVFHYTFVDIPGAAEADDAASAPSGFDDNVAAAAANDYATNPDIDTTGLYDVASLKKNYTEDEIAAGESGDGRVAGDLKVGWWENCKIGSSVYTDTRVVPWIQNTVTHLPFIDGAVADSLLYTDGFGAGYTPAAEQGVGQYAFPNTGNPYGRNSYYGDASRRAFQAMRLMTQRGDSFRDHMERARFQRRCTFSGTTDLIPLGGAFAKRCPEMWDGEVATAWENAGGADGKGDGIPDWYEEYVRNNYSPHIDPADSLSWGTLVDYNGAELEAGLAYMIDLARGMLPDGTIHPEFADRADSNGNNIPDWWERLFGLEDCDAEDDFDNDGLTNFAEYIISFGDAPWGIPQGMPFLDPTNPRTAVTQMVTDYYLPGPADDVEGEDGGFIAGGQYLGEIATDHDFMENWWENQYSRNYANPRVYDPGLERDGDVWDNFSENRAFTWYGGYFSEIIDRYLDGNSENHEQSYPRPAIGIRPTYHGDQNISGATLVARVIRDGQNLADATFTAYGSNDIADNTGGYEVTQMIGLYFGDTTLHGVMHPGHLIPGSVHKFEMRRSDAEPVYYWHCDNCGINGVAGETWLGGDSDWMGTEAQYLAHRRAHGTQRVTLTQTVLAYDQLASTTSVGDGSTGNIVYSGDEEAYQGQVIGKVNFLTGEWELDLGKVSTFGISLENMVFRERHYYRLGDEWPQTVWMSNPSSGHLKQGKATVEAFFDLNGDGVYTAGEPYGVAKGVEIGWHRTGVHDIELRDTAATLPRIDLANGSVDWKAILGPAANVTVPSATGGDGEDGEEAQYGLVRTLHIKRTEINGKPCRERGVATCSFLAANRAYLTEADVINSDVGVFDLDWPNLAKDAKNLLGEGVPVTSAKYVVEEIVEQEDGTTAATAICTFVKEFSETRSAAYPVAPVQNEQVYSNSPVLRFESADDKATAFRVQIESADDEGAAFSWDSGVRLVPARTSETVAKQSVYKFTPDIYVDAPAGAAGEPVFEDGKTYRWRVALMDAAHPDSTLEESDWSEWAEFDLDVANANANPAVPTGYGMVSAAVRYYGSNPDASTENAIIVEAHASADFAGRPLAQVRVEDVAQLADVTDILTPNATLRGIAPQTVWLVAWIDANDNGKRDPWETWGYANHVGLTRFDIYTPLGAAVGESMSAAETLTIYLEDTDLNRNEVLDWRDIEENGEEIFSVDPLSSDDADGDGLTFAEENVLGLDAGTADTDGDGMPDGWEALFTNGTVDPQIADADATSGEDGDFMAYAEIKAVLVTVENANDGATAVWAMPAKYQKTTEGYEGVERTAPRTGDIIASGDVETLGLLSTYEYGDVYGVGLAPAIGAGEGWRVTKVDASGTVALVHAQVYEYFGFDSRTCTGADAANTKQMTALDKYLVLRYFDAIGLADEAAANANKAWEGVTLDPSTADTDGDGIPDGWELYTMFEGGDSATVASLGDAQISPWNYDDARALSPSGLALVDEWSRGVAPTDPWNEYSSGTGISDADAFRFNIKSAATQLLDEDNDGLSNYAEYLAWRASVAAGAELPFDVKNATSVDPKRLDYFAEIVQDGRTLYAGEAFDAQGKGLVADHDFMEDYIEDLFRPSAGGDMAGYNRYRYDARNDADLDGWSNWSEVRANFNTNTFVQTGTVTSTSIVVFDVGTEEFATWRNTNTAYVTMAERQDPSGVWSTVSSESEEGQASTAPADGAQRMRYTLRITTPVMAYGGRPAPKIKVRVYGVEGSADTVSIGAYSGSTLAVADQTFSGGGTVADGIFTATYSGTSLKQGMNTFVATAGGKTGFARVEVGFDQATVEIGLEETPLYMVVDASTGATTAENADETAEADGDGENAQTADSTASAAATGTIPLRIVRTHINGNETEYSRTVYATAVETGRTYAITPAVLQRIAAMKDFDSLTLAVDADTASIRVQDIITVSYNVYAGSMETAVGSFTRTFDATETAPVPIEPMADAGYRVLTAQPAFVFSASAGYPYFRLQVSRTADFADGDIVYDRVDQMPPAATTSGRRTFRPELYVGEGLEDQTKYYWRVKQLNAKFSDNKWSIPSEFMTAIDSTNADTGYGKLAVDVRYYGPSAETLENVVVALYPSADFTGSPVARKRLVGGAAVSTLASTVADGKTFYDLTANVTFDGIAPGTWYAMAFIDTPDADGEYNGVRDPFESWGYVNKVGTLSQDLYTPVAAPVYSTRSGMTDEENAVPEPVLLVIEDTDVNQNDLPDAAEDMTGWRDTASDGADTDGDGLTLAEEADYGCDPANPDTDGDGIPDGWEALYSEGVVDPQVADSDATTGVSDDVMAYSEIPAILVAVTNKVSGGAAEVWAMPARYGQSTSGSDTVLGTPPQVGDVLTSAEIDRDGYFKTYDYGEYYGIGRMPETADSWTVLEVEADRSVLLVHAQVYAYYGFDSRTCVPGEEAVNTKEMTALDKYLVIRYFEALGLADEAAANASRDWKGLTLKPDMADNDLDGIPDGWELYTMFPAMEGGAPLDGNGDPVVSLDALEISPWNYDDARTREYQEMLLLDEWSRGVAPTDPWNEYSSGSGISDALAFRFNIKSAATQLLDEDNDGLSNWAEYLAYLLTGENFDVKVATSVDPAKLDYFIPVEQGGKTLYAGEAFDKDGKGLIADHDFMEDFVEDTFRGNAANNSDGDYNRYRYDAHRDGDLDGWSNWSEIRAYFNTNTYVQTGTRTSTSVLTFAVGSGELGSWIATNKAFVVTAEAQDSQGAWTTISSADGETPAQTMAAVGASQMRYTIRIDTPILAYGGRPAPRVRVKVYGVEGDATNVTIRAYSGATPGAADQTFSGSGTVADGVFTATYSGTALKQGRNMFVATATASENDRASDTADTIDASKVSRIGVVRNVEVGFDETTVEIGLKDSDLFFNIAATDATGEEEDNDPQADDDDAADATEAAIAASFRHSVRIVRTAINGQTLATPRSVYSTTAKKGETYFYSEAELVRGGTNDFDSIYLERDAKTAGIEPEAIVNATYAVYSGASETPVKVFTRYFDGSATAPVPNDMYKDLGYRLLSAQPEFVFVAREGYPAFQIQVADTEDFADGDLLYDRVEPMPAAKADGRHYKPELYVGDAAMNGKTFENGRKYYWRVRQLNAKFPDNVWSEPAEFFTAIDSTNSDTGYGKVAVDVRYYGPSEETLDNVVVALYRTADFTGRPVARLRLGEAGTSVSTLATTVADGRTFYDLAANVTFDGVAPGEWYAMAFIDTPDADGEYNGARDPFESWGYVNKVGTRSQDIYTPVAAPAYMTHVNMTTGEDPAPALKPVLLVIEDTDVDQDGTPDAMQDMTGWEERPTDESGDSDADGDGLTTSEENGYGTDPANFDTDGDGMPDGWEAKFTEGWTDPQYADGDVVNGAEEDVMAYAEIRIALVTVSNTVDGTEAKWAMPVKRDAAVSGGLDVFEHAPPQVGDVVDAASVQTNGLLSTYKYGSETDYVWGLGLAPAPAAGEEWRVIEVATNETAALVHSQVYAYYGFDSKTCVPGEDAVNTKRMTALDKYLVLRYLDALGLADEAAVNKAADWDGWTLKPGMADFDLDGIPDGWELYTMFEGGDSATVASLGDAQISPWNYDDRERLHDGLKLLDEYDLADMPTDPWSDDTDRDGISDAIAFAYHIKGARMLDDDDGDGLSNYAEYLLSERFDLGVKFSADDPRSVNENQLDYFYKPSGSELYVGEIFTDYDMISDVWEDGRGSDLASRYTWDADFDGDEDGWSAWAEAMAERDYATWIATGTVSNETTGAVATIMEYAGRPSPIVTLKLRYNGTRRVVEAATGGGNGGDAAAAQAGETVATNHTPIVAEFYTRDGLLVRDAKYSRSVEGDLQAQPLTVSLHMPDDGRLKEGVNTVVAYCDLDKDGAYTPGEPLGVATGVEIGWRGGYAEIELTDTSPIITRVAIVGAASADAGGGEDGAAATDRHVVWGTEDGDHYDLVVGQDTGGQIERIRVIRTLINGVSVANYADRGVENEVVLDTMLTLGQRAYLFEGDILAKGEFDLDWNNLSGNVVSRLARVGIDVTNVVYRIVLGNGSIELTATNNLFSVATTRRFDSVQQVPVEVAPGELRSTVYTARPEFKWTMNGFDTYTAFRLQITKEGTDTVVWDSGVLRAPPRDSDGNYVFRPDAYAGCELESNTDYSWRVTMYNAKFRSDRWSTGAASFRMATPADGGVYGAMPVCVKYFGPAAALSASTIKVEAYSTPDFTGEPLARGKVAATDRTSVTGTVANAANVWLQGLEKGSNYYVRAFLDMNAYGATNKVDVFEARGYACAREKDLDDPYRPSQIFFGHLTGTNDLVTVYIEDADSNGNRLPDTWEMAANGGRLYDGAMGIDGAIAGSIPVRSALVSALKSKELSDAQAPLSGGLDTLVVRTLGTRAGAALALGVSADRLEYSADGTGRVLVKCAVESVTIESVDISADGKATLEISGKVAEKNDYEASQSAGFFGTSVVAAEPSPITVSIYRKTSLADDWGKPVATAVVPVAEGETKTVTLDAPAAQSGFYKVVVE